MGRVAILAEKHGADGPVLVDLHATGHAVSLLRAPGGIMKVLRTGVLYERAKKIEEMLQDPVRTAFVTVALPKRANKGESASVPRPGPPQVERSPSAQGTSQVRYA